MRGLLRTRLTRRAVAGLVEPGNRDARDPGRTDEEVGVARVHGGDGTDIVLVDQLDQLAEPRAGHHHIGGGKRQGQREEQRGQVLGIYIDRSDVSANLGGAKGVMLYLLP